MLSTYVPGSAPSALSAGTVNGSRTAWLLMVMPRSRSMSIRSRYCARIVRSSTTPVACSIRSASVDLPWSMCAMMQKLRITDGSVRCGTCADLSADGTGGTQDPMLARTTGGRAILPRAANALAGLATDRDDREMTTPVAAGTRIPWEAVPEHVRGEVDASLGSPVVSARTQVGGFSPG